MTGLKGDMENQQHQAIQESRASLADVRVCNVDSEMWTLNVNTERVFLFLFLPVTASFNA